MRWVVGTALGSLVEPEVKRNLAMLSGPTRAKAASAAPVSAGCSSSAKALHDQPGSSPSLNSSGTSRAMVVSMARA
ncbi:hypothetical protein D3C80_2120900 [compost metagenome]